MWKVAPTLAFQQNMQTRGNTRGSSTLGEREWRWEEPAAICLELASGHWGAKGFRQQTDKEQDVTQCRHTKLEA